MQIYSITMGLSRSPRGERGLKYHADLECNQEHRSLPARGAWIEINGKPTGEFIRIMSLPARGAWIEIRINYQLQKAGIRRSPRGERGLKSGAGINTCYAWLVAPREGSVD